MTFTLTNAFGSNKILLEILRTAKIFVKMKIYNPAIVSIDDLIAEYTVVKKKNQSNSKLIILYLESPVHTKCLKF